MTWEIVALVVLAVVVITIAVVALEKKRRSAALRRRFGPEYDRAVDEHGERRAAEAELRGRVKRRADLHLRELSPAARDQYVAEWRAVQARFVDEPRESIVEAERLVDRLAADRGYPAEDRLEMLAVDHPRPVDDHRVAHEVVRQGDRDESDVAIDDLRAAFVRHRRLFEALVEDGDGRDRSAPTGGRGPDDGTARRNGDAGRTRA